MYWTGAVRFLGDTDTCLSLRAERRGRQWKRQLRCRVGAPACGPDGLSGGGSGGWPGGGVCCISSGMQCGAKRLAHDKAQSMPDGAGGRLTSSCGVFCGQGNRGWSQLWRHAFDGGATRSPPQAAQGGGGSLTPPQLGLRPLVRPKSNCSNAISGGGPPGDLGLDFSQWRQAQRQALFDTLPQSLEHKRRKWLAAHVAAMACPRACTSLGQAPLDVAKGQARKCWDLVGSCISSTRQGKGMPPHLQAGHGVTFRAEQSFKIAARPRRLAAAQQGCT